MREQTISLATIVILLFASGCYQWGSSDKEQKGLNQRTPNAEIMGRFHTRQNPGKWKNLKQAHVPSISVSKTDQQRNISVRAPFRSEPKHYLELIVLLDSRFKEVAKTDFGRYDRRTETAFYLPLKQSGEFYVVLKCNLHGMWMQHVLIQPKPDK